jgi:hypothetical protein
MITKTKNNIATCKKSKRIIPDNYFIELSGFSGGETCYTEKVFLGIVILLYYFY